VTAVAVVTALLVVLVTVAALLPPAPRRPALVRLRSTASGRRQTGR
jgi:hypothetical protein